MAGADGEVVASCAVPVAAGVGGTDRDQVAGVLEEAGEAGELGAVGVEGAVVVVGDGGGAGVAEGVAGGGDGGHGVSVRWVRRCSGRRRRV